MMFSVIIKCIFLILLQCTCTSTKRIDIPVNKDTKTNRYEAYVSTSGIQYSHSNPSSEVSRESPNTSGNMENVNPSKGHYTSEINEGTTITLGALVGHSHSGRPSRASSAASTTTNHSRVPGRVTGPSSSTPEQTKNHRQSTRVTGPSSPPTEAAKDHRPSTDSSSATPGRTKNPGLSNILQRPEVMITFLNQLINSPDPTSLQTLMAGLNNVLQKAGNSSDASSLQKMWIILGGLGTAGSSEGNVLNTVLSFVHLVLSEIEMMSTQSLSSEDQCTTDFLAYIQGVRNLDMWALKMLDASGKPGDSLLEGALKFLGNYDECLEISQTVTNDITKKSHVIKGNYCHITLTLPEAILNATMDIPFPLGVPKLQWDLCLPMSCNDTQVFDAVSKLPLNETGMSLVSVKFVEQKDWKQDSVAIATIVVLSIIVLLSVIGTVYDVITSEIKSTCERRHSQGEGRINDVFFFNHPQHLDKRLSSNGTTGAAFENVEIYQGRKSTPQDGFGRQLLLSFSLSRNTEKILNTRTGDSNLGCIHGIRVLSMAWVILGHSMTWESMKTWINSVEYAAWTRRFTMQFLVNGTLSVDTFFVLTGCLVTYLFLKESEKTSKGKPTVSQMVLYYVHRWWRLTPVYMVLVLFSTGIMRYLITGPLAELKDQLDPDNCRTYWWANILYINNFYDFSHMCYPVTWFLANDMQFYFIAPLALLPLAFGVSWLGYTVISLFLATHLSMYGYLEWKYDGATQFTNNGPAMNDIYIVPWCRIGAFAIGMFLGTILHRTGCKIRMRRFGLLLGWQLFLGIGLLCTYMTYDQFRVGSAGWGVNSRIIHETLYRPGWSLFVSWVILVCCTGYGGFINSLLSWSPWIPLGRLTYGAYLIHPMLLSYTEFTLRALRYMDIPYLSYHFIGTFAVSYALSFLTCVLIESPCMGLERAVLWKLGVKK